VPTADELQSAKEKFGDAAKQMQALQDVAARLDEAAKALTTQLGDAYRALEACPKADMASWGAALDAVLEPIGDWDPRQFIVNVGEAVGRAKAANDAAKQVAVALNGLAAS
jgi:hypothetical protein